MQAQCMPHMTVQVHACNKTSGSWLVKMHSCYCLIVSEGGTGSGSQAIISHSPAFHLLWYVQVLFTSRCSSLLRRLHIQKITYKRKRFYIELRPDQVSGPNWWLQSGSTGTALCVLFIQGIAQNLMSLVFKE